MLTILKSRLALSAALLLVPSLALRPALASAPYAGDLTAVSPPPADTVAVSQVRIVRLSQVNGKVLLDRRTEHGFEPAFANLPIAQGSRLQTADGLAEVEFEDNSSLRVAPNSQVDFAQLGREASGATVNGMLLQKGTLYLSLTKAKGNLFEVTVGSKTISLPPASHIRLDVYPDGSELAVLHGKVVVTDASSKSTWTVGTEKAFKFSDTSGAQPVLVADDRPGLYDQWDKSQADYHNNRVGSAFAGTPYQYGLNDLNYYGAFSNVAGCGQVWQPYLASASWDPFSTGIWAWYPGTGYSWVSPYPWGWTPFHSGSWISCPNGAGWGWRPGNNWSGVNNVLALHPTRGPKPPLRPIPGRSGLVVVGASLARQSHVANGQNFEFAKDSAGLGVPRDLPVKLQKISAQVSARGTVQAPVQGIANFVVPASAARTGNERKGNETSSLTQRSAVSPQRADGSSPNSQRATSRPLAPVASGSATSGGSYSAPQHASSSVSAGAATSVSRSAGPSGSTVQGGGSKGH